MYTRRDKRERKKRKKTPTHSHTHTHTTGMSHAFIFFFPFASRERKADSETVPSRHWPPSYSHRCFKSSSVCVCAPCLRRAKHCFAPRAVFWFFVLEPCCPPRPRHCFFSHQRRDCLCVWYKQFHQKYNLTALFTLRVFLSFFCPIRARGASGILFIRV